MTSPQEMNARGRDGVQDARTAEDRRDTAAAYPVDPDPGRPGADRPDTDRTDADRTEESHHRRDRDRSGEGSHVTGVSDRRSVVSREKERFGGIKWGSAFFGWLTATGAAVILTSLLIAGGAAVGVDTNIGDTTTSGQAAKLGVGGAIALLAVLLIAYFCGGYVAGRMARFNGVKQGVAVWIWGIVIAVVVAVAGKVLGDKYDVLAKLGGFPRLPFSGGDVTAAAIVAVVIAVVATLVGAVLGGLAGMRFHRRVDRAGLGD